MATEIILPDKLDPSLDDTKLQSRDAPHVVFLQHKDPGDAHAVILRRAGYDSVEEHVTSWALKALKMETPAADRFWSKCQLIYIDNPLPFVLGVNDLIMRDLAPGGRPADSLKRAVVEHIKKGMALRWNTQHARDVALLHIFGGYNNYAIEKDYHQRLGGYADMMAMVSYSTATFVWWTADQERSTEHFVEFLDMLPDKVSRHVYAIAALFWELKAKKITCAAQHYLKEVTKSGEVRVLKPRSGLYHPLVTYGPHKYRAVIELLCDVGEKYHTFELALEGAKIAETRAMRRRDRAARK